MLVWQITSILSALCLVPVLAAGAQSDYRGAVFPARFWDSGITGLLVKLSIVISLVTYILIAASGDYFTLGVCIALAVIGALFFAYMGFAFGSGGDMRALMYIAFLEPWFLIWAVIASLVIGGVIAGYKLIAKTENDVPLIARTIRFAIPLLIGYSIVILFTIVTI